MNFTLITPTPPDISAFGIRILSAYLKNKGHNVKSIFLPGGIDKLRMDGSYKYEFESTTLDDVREISKSSDIIGISFMTYYFDRGIQIADYLREKLGTPVILGGIHPTVSPDECLDHCDALCIGEGEVPMVSLANNNGVFDDVPNLVYKRCNDIICSEVAPLITDLDALPFFDFSLENQYVLNHESSKIESLTMSNFRDHLSLLPGKSGHFNVTYRTMSTRGCPHECFYCANKYLKSLYPGQKFMRCRSPENVIKELEHIKKSFDFIQGIQFFDDTFFAASTDYIQKFSELYHDKITLPLYCQCSPSTITEKKLELLIKAGLIMLEMGIQTGSEKEAETFHRTESRDQLQKSISMINTYNSSTVRPHYHLILDSPWLATEDLEETLSLLLKIPVPYKLCLASLTFFPGTELHIRAMTENLIKDKLKQIYRKPFYRFNGNYLNFLIVLCGIEFIPRFLIKFLANNFFISLCHRQKSSAPFSLLIVIAEKLRVIHLGIKSLFSKDLKKISSHLKEIK